MKKDELLQTLKHISDSYFQKKDYISAGMINRAIDVVNDYDGVLPQADVIGSNETLYSKCCGQQPICTKKNDV